MEAAQLDSLLANLGDPDYRVRDAAARDLLALEQPEVAWHRLADQVGDPAARKAAVSATKALAEAADRAGREDWWADEPQQALLLEALLARGFDPGIRKLSSSRLSTVNVKVARMFSSRAARM